MFNCTLNPDVWEDQINAWDVGPLWGLVRDNTAETGHEGPFVSFPLPSHAVPFFLECLRDKEKPLKNVKQGVT